MARLNDFLAAFALVLLVWTGVPAHAAQTFDCDGISCDSGARSGGSSDEAPATGQTCKCTNAACCHAPQFFASLDKDMVRSPSRTTALPVAPDEQSTAGREPDGQLRPPIA